MPPLSGGAPTAWQKPEREAPGLTRGATDWTSQQTKPIECHHRLLSPPCERAEALGLELFWLGPTTWSYSPPQLSRNPQRIASLVPLGAAHRKSFAYRFCMAYLMLADWELALRAFRTAVLVTSLVGAGSPPLNTKAWCDKFPLALRVFLKHFLVWECALPTFDTLKLMTWFRLMIALERSIVPPFGWGVGGSPFSPCTTSWGELAPPVSNEAYDVAVGTQDSPLHSRLTPP